MAPKYSIGDLVWAKMKGFSPWPAKIVEPTKEVKRPSIKRPMQCVFFFGSDNYAWVVEDMIKPYEPGKESYRKQNKSGLFKEALEAIDDYIRSQGKQPIKSSELPSIDEELALLFCDTSKKKVKRRRSNNLDRENIRDPLDFFEKSPSTSSLSPEPVSESAPELTENLKPERKIKPKKRKDDSLTERPKSKRDSSDSSNSSQAPKKSRKSNDVISATVEISNSMVSGDETPNVVFIPSPRASPTPSNHSFTLARSTSPAISSQYTSSNSNKTTSGLLMRPTYVTRPVTPPLDVEKVSDMLKEKKVVASDLKFGFLGLGIMGQGIVKNLLNSGHSVIVWNRTPSKCRDFVKAGATKGQTPADVVAAADITFCCVSDPTAAKEMVYGNCGVLQEINNNKGYVEMTSIDPETSQDIAEAVISRNGRYLEAPVSGSKRPAEEGLLIVLAAGDRTLFNDCSSCFQAMGKHAFYLGDVGNGSKMNLTLNMLLGSTLSSLAEAMALADRAGLSQRDLVEILELGDLNCKAIVQKGRAIIDGTFPTNMPLQHMQKDLRLALSIGDQLEQPLPVAASACEVFKHAKRMGYSEHDVSAVYIRARF